MNQLTWPIVFALSGALLFAFAPGKAGRLGEIMFFTGMLWLVYSMSHGALHF